MNVEKYLERKAGKTTNRCDIITQRGTQSYSQRANLQYDPKIKNEYKMCFFKLSGLQDVGGWLKSHDGPASTHVTNVCVIHYNFINF